MGRRKKPESKEKRTRKSVQIQLDMAKAREKELADYYVASAKSGQWKQDFIDAMRLLLSLRNDSLKVMRTMYPEIVNAWEVYSGIKNKNYEAFKELFPDLYMALKQEIFEALQVDTIQELRAIGAKIDNLKSVQALTMSQGNAGIKALSVAQVAAPNFDDDDDLVLTANKDEGAGFKANQNFLNSVMALQK